MRTLVVDSYEALSREAAALVTAQLARKPQSLFVVPTGATPLGLFRELVAARDSGRVDVSRAAFAVLDEYAGITLDDRRSLSGWLTRELLAPLGIGSDRVLYFDPRGDRATEGARMDAAIAARGGIDLAILGLGPNGHLGFNEPGSAFDSPARLATLSAESIRSNASYWGSEDDVPRTGFTLGLGTLRKARQLVLMISGAHKTEILARVLAGPPSPVLPATILHVHVNALVLADRAALPAGA